jgi:hypothetical protein
MSVVRFLSNAALLLAEDWVELTIAIFNPVNSLPGANGLLIRFESQYAF